MELLPPVGWADVATKHDLAALDERMELRFAAVDQRFDAGERHLEAVLDAKLEGLRHELLDALHRDQIALTWRYLGVTGWMFLAFSARHPRRQALTRPPGRAQRDGRRRRPMRSSRRSSSSSTSATIQMRSRRLPVISSRTPAAVRRSSAS